MNEDLSGWIKCYGGCGGWLWRTHTPSTASHTTFTVNNCVQCDYNNEISYRYRQYSRDLYNKISVKNKWVRDTGERSAERVSRTTEAMFKHLETEKALEIYEEIFSAHVDKVVSLWARNLRQELSHRQQ